MIVIVIVKFLPATSLATSEPAPIAIPMFACFSAGASFTPIRHYNRIVMTNVGNGNTVSSNSNRPSSSLAFFHYPQFVLGSSSCENDFLMR